MSIQGERESRSQGEGPQSRVLQIGSAFEWSKGALISLERARSWWRAGCAERCSSGSGKASLRPLAR